MFKGISKIELFDGLTGKKKDESINQNMETDALKNMFGFGSEMLMAGVRMDTILERLTPMFPAYLRGIMLWDDVLPERRDLVFAPEGINCVGHAGGTYAGAKLTRGTYNVNESREITNGVRMVWDFGTDRANGTIKAASLTSIFGGDAGWFTPRESGVRLVSFINPTQNYSTGGGTIVFAPSNVNTMGGFIYVGELSRGVFTWVINSGNNLRVLEQRFTPANAIGMRNKCGILNRDNTTETVSVIQSGHDFGTAFNNSWIIDENGHFVSVVPLDATNVRVRHFDLVAKQQLSERVITLDRAIITTTSRNNVFFKKKLYANITANTIGEFDENGRYLRNAIESNLINTLHSIGDLLVCGQATGTHDMRFIRGGKTSMQIEASIDRPTCNKYYNSVSFKPPFFTNGGVGDASVSPSCGFVTSYIATINNLQNTVIKTSADTMKITYDLTQA
jgi:hypothetical protein